MRVGEKRGVRRESPAPRRVRRRLGQFGLGISGGLFDRLGTNGEGTVLRQAQDERMTYIAPSPLMGEGWSEGDQIQK